MTHPIPFEIEVFTTDNRFVDDLNSASIPGVSANYRPTMAFDSVDGLCQILIEIATGTAANLVAHWVQERCKKTPPRQIRIENKNVQNSQITIVVNEYVERKGKAD